MKSSKKSSPKSDASQSKKPSFFDTLIKTLFKNSKAKTSQESPLQTEANVVPKTEFTASRQALNNISLALADESSGEGSGIQRNDKEGGCKNKYCCEVIREHVNEPVDKCDESIEDNKNSKTKLIENLRPADNGAQGEKKSADETERRPSGVRDSDYSVSPSEEVFLEVPKVKGEEKFSKKGTYFDVKKSKHQRFYLNIYEVYGPKYKIKGEDFEKTPVNFELLSFIEKSLDQSKYNLMKVRAYNANFQRLRDKYDIPQIELEDFQDDEMNTPMSEDTRAIKEFYNLSMERDINIHFDDIAVDTDVTEEFPNSCTDFFKWLMLKGKEVKEKKESCAWMRAILEFFSKLSE